jgi:hypothetical protein
MNYFWGNVFEYFKERRYAAVFFGTLAALAGMLAVAVMLEQIVRAYELQDQLVYLLPGMALLFGARVARGIVRERARRCDRYKISPLSRDELDKARSKLVRQR